MKARTIVTGVLILIVAWSVSTSNAQQEKVSDSDSKLRDLLMEKRDVLQRRSKLIKARFDDGTVTYDTVLQAQELLLNAELELATTKKKERLKILEKRIANYRYLENLATQTFVNGRGRAEERFLATANRIQAQIDHVREESNPH